MRNEGMSKFTGIAKLEEMKLMSGGNPNKIAMYKLEERTYNDTAKEIFDEDAGYPFTNVPAEHYLQRLEKEAAAEDADEQAKMRYEMMKDRRDYFKYKRDEEQKVTNATRSELVRKLNEGVATNNDVALAEKNARMFSNSENIALYTSIKRQAEENK